MIKNRKFIIVILLLVYLVLGVLLISLKTKSSVLNLEAKILDVKLDDVNLNSFRDLNSLDKQISKKVTEYENLVKDKEIKSSVEKESRLKSIDIFSSLNSNINNELAAIKDLENSIVDDAEKKEVIKVVEEFSTKYDNYLINLCSRFNTEVKSDQFNCNNYLNNKFDLAKYEKDNGYKKVATEVVDSKLSTFVNSNFDDSLKIYDELTNSNEYAYFNEVKTKYDEVLVKNAQLKIKDIKEDKVVFTDDSEAVINPTVETEEVNTEDTEEVALKEDEKKDPIKEIEETFETNDKGEKLFCQVTEDGIESQFSGLGNVTIVNQSTNIASDNYINYTSSYGVMKQMYKVAVNNGFVVSDSGNINVNIIDHGDCNFSAYVSE